MKDIRSWPVFDDSKMFVQDKDCPRAEKTKLREVLKKYNRLAKQGIVRSRNHP